jgi:hypothetical protein
MDPDWRPSDHPAYCYLLGLYLGDGCITQRSQNSSSMTLTMDSGYPGVIEEAAAAIQRVFPQARVSRHNKHEGRCLNLQVSNASLPVAFPQHGPGNKHLRKIELVGWQRELTRQHPGQLLRGLIHSDGCRTFNEFDVKLLGGRVGHYRYPRYFFTNLSADIRGIFCDHCELLGIRWTQSNHRNISVSHRDSVAILDSFVGPKT